MKNYRKLASGVLGALFVASCSTSGPGVTDYRRVEQTSLKDARQMAADSTNKCQRTQFGKPVKACKPLVPARLLRKNVGIGRNIPAEHVYSIRLDHGFLAESEDTAFGWFVGDHDGEIAVLVNAFEMAGNAEQAKEAGFRFLDFAQTTKDEGGNLQEEFGEARVVYFNPDVAPESPMNFSNLPITGPVKYEGRPIGLQIILVELDEISQPIKSMLSSLAGLGRTYVNAGPVSDTLFDLGESLIEGSQDDIIFEYRMLMDNASTTDQQIVAPFEAGRMVFRTIKNQKRAKVWRNLELDENTGRLFYYPNGSDEPEPYNDETYFVVNIIDHGKSGPLGFYENKRLDEVRERFVTSINDETKHETVIAGNIKALQIERRSALTAGSLETQLEGVVEQWRRYSALALHPDLEQSQMRCDALTALRAREAERTLAKSAATRATADFLTSINDQSDDLVTAEQTHIMGRLDTALLSSLGNNKPPSGYASNHFSTLAAFKNQFVPPSSTPSLAELFAGAAELGATLPCPRPAGN